MSRKCHLCHKDNAKACCGGCKSVFYCDRQCQVKHWTAHKSECKEAQTTDQLDMDHFDFTLPPFDHHIIDICDTKNGYGMLSTCDIKRGTIICTERAIIVLPEFAKSKMTFYIKQQFLLLSKTQKNIYKSLSPKMTTKNDTSSNDNLKLLSIFVNNQITIKEGKSACIFPLISRVNHCCIGNAHWTWNETLKQLRLVALKDIQKDEEIMVNYCVEPMVMNDRKARLKSGWNIVCECAMCCNDKMEHVMREYLTLNKSLESAISKPLEGYKAAQKLVKTVEKHFATNPELMYKHCYDAAQFALGLQKWSEASYYLEMSMKEKQVAQGNDVKIESEFMDKVHLLPTKFQCRFRKFDPKYTKQKRNKKDDDQKQNGIANGTPTPSRTNGKPKANKKPNAKANHNRNNKGKNNKKKKKKKKTKK
eukprot:194896_1